MYRQLIGSLMYLANTRSDICFVVNTLNQFMVDPKRAHWTTTKHIMRYLQGIVEYGLKYTQGDGVRLLGYTDVDWEGNVVDKKCTSGVASTWIKELSLSTTGSRSLLH